MPDRVRRNVAAWLLLLAAGGCRSGPLSDVAAESPAAVAADGKPRSPPRTIPIEVVFIRHDEQDLPLRDELWNLVDEQALDREVRDRLQANGLRAGVVTGPLPPHIAARFVPPPPAAGETLATSLEENPALMRHVLRLLPGRSSDVMAATGLDPLVLLEHDGDGVRGTTYRDASPLFSVRAWPAADGHVRLKLSPMIKHGPVERSWVGEDGMFRLEAGQRRDMLEGLEFESTIPAGAMVVMGCVGEPASPAGDAFFRDRAGGRRAGVRLLAIRAVPGQWADPLFSPAREEPDPGAGP